METEARAVVVDLVHIEAVETVDLEPVLVDVAPETDRERSEASSASRTASLVAPTPPDPDYFVG